MTWNCNAITNGLTIFPNGKIGPCCQISADYLKSIEKISDSNRFIDLQTEHPPSACESCISLEHNNLPSYRQFFNNFDVSKTCKNIVFLDIRNTNQCNLKCRYCGPHFSNQWAQELKYEIPLKHTSIREYTDQLISNDIQVLYFTGGEPFISADHWNLLETIIQHGISEKVLLMYNTNLTVLKYKNLDIIDIWSKFKKVNLMVSFESIGPLFENIRSNASWEIFEKNLKSIKNFDINVTASAVLSILNVWSLSEFVEFCVNEGLKINFTLLDGPDYLALDVIPDEFKELAINELTKARQLLGNDYDNFFASAINKVTNNINQCLINQTINHVLLLDKLRNENMFDFLPFSNYSKNLILRNNEYE